MVAEGTSFAGSAGTGRFFRLSPGCPNRRISCLSTRSLRIGVGAPGICSMIGFFSGIIGGGKISHVCIVIRIIIFGFIKQNGSYRLQLQSICLDIFSIFFIIN